jgi:hypothetical protein
MLTKYQQLMKLRKLNAAIKKDQYPLPFTNEMLHTMARYEAYSFLDDIQDIIKYL